ncbi:transglycosylase SLT domain-containing protein [Streptomyces sp. NPDC086023]|uniref:transglycosylase SLT domain-containing protein n=1 Tax=Streptomyces sp. NPDC086023 TaxID=3365746 RepID=UPI0037CE3501
MAAGAKHRRPSNSRISRKFLAVGTGGAALALPMLGTTGAEAAPDKKQSTAAAKPKAPPAAQPVYVSYSVVAGDSMAGIAKMHKLAGGWQRLHKDNRTVVGDDPSRIRPGMKLRIDLRAVAGGQTAAEAAVKAKAKAPAKASAKAKAPAPAKAPAKAAPAKAQAKKYPDNLDGWIREALDVMAKHGIPGSYEGIHRNIMRESSGNPKAINTWDINAQNGTPSKGLLQVIDPTFKAYHVKGTPFDPFHPVANIAAACNYAAAKYKFGIDGVNGPY